MKAFYGFDLSGVASQFVLPTTDLITASNDFEHYSSRDPIILQRKLPSGDNLALEDCPRWSHSKTAAFDANLLRSSMPKFLVRAYSDDDACMGRRPVIIARNESGEIIAYLPANVVAVERFWPINNIGFSWRRRFFAKYNGALPKSQEEIFAFIKAECFYGFAFTSQDLAFDPQKILAEMREAERVNPKCMQAVHLRELREDFASRERRNAEAIAREESRSTK